ncbi:ComEA family DNA-binding protein [Deinococcus sp.]|uniref:ComEA family DNA-binding protein n=1 Tax=Deinococcus sp. TaxID=47478 RepID=UPI003CC6BBAC
MKNATTLLLGLLTAAALTGTTLAASGTTTMTKPSMTMTMPPAGFKVSVNTGSAADLMKVPGISDKIAADLMKNRPYKNQAELVKKVKGIGPKNVLKMATYLSY